ncbi:coenzyme F420-0:L-glutamate ligase [Candidatus Daviesbacteria bacterium]|nr:coenzyme F420-0:L-glutamate ligase [Candidatus Daviesbacteria bacterium]
MIVKAIKTHKVTISDKDILRVLDKYILYLKEESIVVIASKIVAICEGRAVKLNKDKLDELIKKESQFFIPAKEHKFNLYITITKNYLTYSSGIDESNGNGYYVLWPKDAQQSANQIRAFLKDKFNIKKVGVVITDMTAIPLQWGVIAGPIAYSGFKPIRNITGTKDVFGKEFKYTKVGIINGLAAGAGAVMGEGAEQTPIGIIEDVPFVEFQDKNPTQEELNELIIEPENDLFGPMIKKANWQKGGS